MNLKFISDGIHNVQQEVAGSKIILETFTAFIKS